MATVYISREHSNIPEALVRSAFDTNMDLMVFSAMLGTSLDDNYQRYKVELQGNEINEGTFINSNKEGVVFLTGLVAKQDGDILREENNNECWKIFEQYAECGFQEMKNWFIDSPGVDKVDLILNKMKLEAKKHIQADDIDTSRISF